MKHQHVARFIQELLVFLVETNSLDTIRAAKSFVEL